MTPADITALRGLLARAKAAGWTHSIYDTFGDREHVWRRTAGVAEQRTSLYAGFVNYDRNHNDPDARSWSVPAESVREVTAVLELAGALPVADRSALIRQAVADPGRFTPRGMSPDCTFARCTCEPISDWTVRAVEVALAGAR